MMRFQEMFGYDYAMIWYEEVKKKCQEYGYTPPPPAGTCEFCHHAKKNHYYAVVGCSTFGWSMRSLSDGPCPGYQYFLDGSSALLAPSKITRKIVESIQCF